MNLNKTRFSVNGTGYFIKMFDKNHPLYKALKLIDKPDISKYLLDHYVFTLMNLKDETGRLYSSFWDIRPTAIFPAYSTDAYTRLEIRRSEGKPIKIFFKDLIRSDYLFPPCFILTETTLVNEGLMVIEYDKGYFGKTMHPVAFLDSTPLSFELLHIPEMNITVVRSIMEDGHAVNLKQPDTVNYGIYGFMI